MINFSDIDFFIYTFFYIIKKKKKNKIRMYGGKNPKNGEKKPLTVF